MGSLNICSQLILNLCMCMMICEVYFIRIIFLHGLTPLAISHFIRLILILSLSHGVVLRVFSRRTCLGSLGNLGIGVSALLFAGL